MDTQETLDQLATEVFFFNLMGKLLQIAPTKENAEWFDTLAREDIFEDVLFGSTQPDILEGAAKIDGWLKIESPGEPPAKIAEINIDYNRLLVGPGTPLAPPWESFYFNDQGLLFQEQTMQVREWFRRFDLESEKIHTEPDDHIGLEFSFLGHLSARAMTSIERDAPDEYESIIEAQRDFLVQHPLNWVSKWCDRMLRNAQTDFYLGVALLVRGGLKELARLRNVEDSAEA